MHIYVYSSYIAALTIIHASYQFSLFTQTRQFVREDTLLVRKVNKDKNKFVKHHFFLFSDILLDTVKTKEGKYKFVQVGSISTYVVMNLVLARIIMYYIANNAHCYRFITWVKYQYKNMRVKVVSSLILLILLSSSFRFFSAIWPSPPSPSVGSIYSKSKSSGHLLMRICMTLLRADTVALFKVKEGEEDRAVHIKWEAGANWQGNDVDLWMQDVMQCMHTCE